MQEDISIGKSAGIKSIWLPESAPLYSQLQQDGQGQVLVLKRNVAFGAGTSVYITGPKEERHQNHLKIIQQILQYNTELVIYQ